MIKLIKLSGFSYIFEELLINNKRRLTIVSHGSSVNKGISIDYDRYYTPEDLSIYIRFNLYEQRITDLNDFYSIRLASCHSADNGMALSLSTYLPDIYVVGYNGILRMKCGSDQTYNSFLKHQSDIFIGSEKFITIEESESEAFKIIEKNLNRIFPTLTDKDEITYFNGKKALYPMLYS
ncbi:MAG: hypothetical protein LBI71_08895 [Enterobacteriaceae bacterium]|jgi:hypothetical protein|nr:hypothetical protein [Enterobacteriaceae bacterium]